MQKYIITFLSILLLTLLVGFWWQKKEYSSQINELNQKLAESQQLVQETKNTWSSAALQIKDLVAANQELNDIIKKRNEKILAQTNLALEWKNKYFQIKNATSTIVDESGSQPASLSSECESCLANKRFRVDFDQEQDNLSIKGYTLTNPGYADLTAEWTKPLKLEINITKDENGNYKAYAEVEHGTPTELTLKIDPSVLQRKWYERIAFGSDLGASQFGLNGSLRVMYGAKNNLYVGPAVTLSIMFTGQVAPFYGVSVLWMPFMRDKQ